MIVIEQKGSFNKTKGFLDRATKLDVNRILRKYGRLGVEALAKETPKDTGKTAASWGYEIVNNKHETTIYWTNSNIDHGVSIAVILRFGHVTGTGGYVQGIDYISPAIRPVFEDIADSAWKEVTG